MNAASLTYGNVELNAHGIQRIADSNGATFKAMLRNCKYSLRKVHALAIL
jgi:hypothetical protein